MDFRRMSYCAMNIWFKKDLQRRIAAMATTHQLRLILITIHEAQERTLAASVALIIMKEKYAKIAVLDATSSIQTLRESWILPRVA